MLGRVIVGMAIGKTRRRLDSLKNLKYMQLVGVSSTTIPSYIAEASPPTIRGYMLVMFQLLITILDFGWLQFLMQLSVIYLATTLIGGIFMLILPPFYY